MWLDKKCRIAVLMGGVSNEREISLKSGRSIAAALREAGHDVVPLEIKDEQDLQGVRGMRADCAFVALHGAYGEDGAVQARLDEWEIPYTGSGPRASELGMDKVLSKRAFVCHSVPTPDYVVLQPSSDTDRVLFLATQIGFPLVCKPARGGSSLGVSIVKSPSELSAAVRQAEANTGQEAQLLLERHIHGREFTVGVVDGRPLPLVEIRSAEPFFNYEAKYYDEDTEYLIPVPLLHSVYRHALELGAGAYRALGCRHMARTDMMYGYDGRLYVLEVNTIPGFTPRSLLPMAAEHAGIPFSQLCERIVGKALQDARSRQENQRQTA
jgi:D-alanine-D-alanine ligase